MTFDEVIAQAKEEREREPAEWPLTFAEHLQLGDERNKFENYLGRRAPLWQCHEYLSYFDSYARTEPMVMIILAANPERRLRIFLESGDCCDAPWPWRSLLADLLRSARKEVDLRECLSPRALTWFDGLPPIIPLYRGCTAGRERGLSWTTDVEVARRFAKGMRCINPAPTLVSAQISKQHVFACFVSRGEHEISLDYRRLRRVLAEPVPGWKPEELFG
jgi:hypothetical protein